MQYLAWIVEPFDTKIRQRLFPKRKALANLPELSDRRHTSIRRAVFTPTFQVFAPKGFSPGEKSLFSGWHGKRRVVSYEL